MSAAADPPPTVGSARSGQPWYELRLLFKPNAALVSPVDPLRLADALAPVLGAGLLDAVTMTLARSPAIDVRLPWWFWPWSSPSKRGIRRGRRMAREIAEQVMSRRP